MYLTTSALSKVAVVISKDLISYGLRSPSKNFLLSAPIPTPWLGNSANSVWKPLSPLDQAGGPDLGADAGRSLSPRDSAPATEARGRGDPEAEGAGQGLRRTGASGSTPRQPAPRGQAGWRAGREGASGNLTWARTHQLSPPDVDSGRSSSPSAIAVDVHVTLPKSGPGAETVSETQCRKRSYEV